ncbi:MAG TPA: bifunctional UDP-sugar hydrolase/5'-nucleotidase [Acetobacteraceae bacterium]|nr:bifunctional UDP-sugar hydrolase/5'-nucleotidase [Acetobacteraceae bacterium]
MRLFRRSLFAALLALAAPAPALAETVRLTFLHVNDIYQHAPQNGRGGLAELGTLVERERAAARGPVFFTLGGDLISPSLASSVTRGQHMIALMNALGLDLAVLGNHEFDFGPEVAAERIRESRFPWLGANVLGPDGRPFGSAVATVMREAAGLRVGFIGVLTPDTAQLARAEGITFTPPAAALRAGIAQLQREGADLVVALTHLDLEDDRRLARELRGLGLLLGGHDHEPYAMLEGGALLMKAGQDAHWLAVIEMEVERPAGGRPARIASLGWRFVPNVGVPPSPAIAPIVAQVEAELDRTLGAPLATLRAPLDSRTSAVRTREAAIGNLVADALRAHFSADAALINGGGLRGNREYPAGHVFTRRDLLGEMPFGNTVMLLELTGAELLGVLEHGLAEVEHAAGRYPQVSGLAVLFNPDAPAGQRVQEVTVGGQPLDPARRYRLATTDYLFNGGDGYTMLRSGRVLVDASGGPLLVNVAAEAIQAAGGIGAQVEGRSRPVRP